MPQGSSGADLDRLLAQELHQQQVNVGRLAPPAPRYRSLALQGGGHMSMLPQFLAGLSLKAAAGITLAAAAVGGGAAATMVTHSVSPVTWGQDVVSALQGCKAQYLPSGGGTNQGTEGQHNVGRCISAIAKTHGEKERALHAKASGTPNPMPTPKGQGRPSSLPTPTGTGRPDSLPTPPGKGRPSSVPPIG
ncbi:MAG: hypothetical protein ACYCS9_00820 [Candidatus Dormibacteria bacterium]